MTFGCKFACNYCPIPAYNQRQHRLKSAGRIADEMWRLNKEYGIRYFFGTDDNFFNNKARTLDIVETLAAAEFEGVPLRRKARWYTEVTVHDTLQIKDQLPLVRKAGCRALWLGVEDMTATLVNKGQSVDKTTEAFRLMREVGICPMPMMMHHDSQPLYSRGSNYGLLNQIRVLRQAGAVSLQVLMMTPSPGTKLFEDTFTKGLVLGRAGGREVRPYMYDGNYVIASVHPRPWRKQFNLLLGYLYFYNPVWFVAGGAATQDEGWDEAGVHADRRDDRPDAVDPPHVRLGAAADVRPDRAPLPAARRGRPDAGRRRTGRVPRAGRRHDPSAGAPRPRGGPPGCQLGAARKQQRSAHPGMDRRRPPARHTHPRLRRNSGLGVTEIWAWMAVDGAKADGRASSGTPEPHAKHTPGPRVCRRHPATGRATARPCTRASRPLDLVAGGPPLDDLPPRCRSCPHPAANAGRIAHVQRTAGRRLAISLRGGGS